MEGILDSVPYFDINIPKDDLENGCKEVVLKLRPTWRREDVTVKSFKAGYSNHVMGCYNEGFKDAIVVRVFGDFENLRTNRRKEIIIGKVLADHKISPEIYGVFQNGICTRYIDGQQYTWDLNELKELRKDEKACKAMMRVFAEMHTKEIDKCVRENGVELSEETHIVFILKALVNYSFPDNNIKDEEKKKRIREEFPANFKDIMKKELDFLIEKSETYDKKTTFGNLDVNATNIVYCRDEDKAYIVDLEHCGNSFISYDICSMFAGTWYGVVVEPEVLLPDEAWQKMLIKEYLDTTLKLGQHNKDQVTDEDIEELYALIQFQYLVYQMSLGLYTFCNCVNENPIFPDVSDDLTWSKYRLIDFYNKLKKHILPTKEYQKYFTTEN